jgi:subtilisin family serine protease
MNDRRLAWSGAFSAEALEMIPQIAHIDDISPEWAWGGSTGKGVKVGVVDSGIDANHPAIGGHVSGYVAVVEEGDATRFRIEPHEDSSGHGTACAGIIRSVAPECELHSVKVLGPGALGRGAIFIAGIRWAIDNGMQVVNLSLGTTRKDFYPMLHEVADLAYFRNVVLVAAANNLPIPSFPSLYASVISVASHGIQDPMVFYYNPRPPVEFGALGIDVRVAWLDGDWLTASGNSFAAPHISGTVARILAKHPYLTLFQVKTVLRALAANIKKEVVQVDAGLEP